MTDPRVAALATDLGLKLGSDLTPRPTPLRRIEEVDDLVEFTPTSGDYRIAQKKAGWRAVYICGPENAVPTVVRGLELWPARIGTTGAPRDIKAIAQLWSWHTIVLHEVLWCDSAKAADALKTMLADALDFRGHHLSFGFYNLAPAEFRALAREVARVGRIAVFDEAERMARLSAAVGAELERAKAEAIAARRALAPPREKRALPWRKEGSGSRGQVSGPVTPDPCNLKPGKRLGRMIEHTRERLED